MPKFFSRLPEIKNWHPLKIRRDFDPTANRKCGCSVDKTGWFGREILLYLYPVWRANLVAEEFELIYEQGFC